MITGGEMKPKKIAKRKPSKANSVLKQENSELKFENLKLQRQIAKLKAKLVSVQNGVIATIERKPLENLTDGELSKIIRQKR